MSSDVLTHPDRVVVREASNRSSRSHGLACIVLAALLVTLVPLFLRMPLWCDATHYDLCARNVLGGGVHYRDVFDTNPPGIVWLHIGIRSLLGWTSEAIRLVDFGIVSAIVWLLVRYLRSLGASPTVQGWTAVALYAFYLTTPEIIHCQRDIWMLFPALLALYLRRSQVTGLSQVEVLPGKAAFRALCEGLCWGTAFWIKPFVIIPGFFCWVLSAAWLLRRVGHRGKMVLLDALGMLAGGLLVGSVGVIWLWWSGTWPYFWDVMFSWNLDYYHRESEFVVPCNVVSFFELIPWSTAHFIAVPVALVKIWQAIVGPLTSPPNWPNSALQEGLLGCFYLGWLVQASCLQQGFNYHHVPAVLLAIVVATRWRGLLPGSRLGWLNRFLFACALVESVYPALQWQRLSFWGRCLAEANSPEMRDHLALTDKVNWEDLDRVAQYLRDQDLRDGDLTCYGTFTNYLYLELNLKPSIRYTQFQAFVFTFPKRREQMRLELAATGQRYIVTDVMDWGAIGLTSEQAAAERPGEPLAFPPAFPPPIAQRYPWTEPVVFRAGRYYVHRVSGPPGSF